MRAGGQNLMRILLLNLDTDSLEAANRALADPAFEVSSDHGLTADQVLALSPEVLVTKATPSSCRELVAQLKAHPKTEFPPKIVMIVHGGALQRARSLDLGADDVISFPFETEEFAARIRAQFRERHPQEKLDTILNYAAQQKQLAEIAIKSVRSVLGNRPLRLIPAIFVLSMAAVLAAIYLGFSSRGARKETRKLQAEVASLGSGLGLQGQLLPHTHLASGPIEGQSLSAAATDDSWKAQSKQLSDGVAAGSFDADSLEHQLVTTEHRLKLLESAGTIAETVVRDYGPSVCLLHVVVEFLDKESGHPLQIAVDATGKPLVDEKGMVQLDDGGAGPHLQIDVFGTGFLAKRTGKIITNHHVVEPWWKNDEVKPLLDQGATAYVLSYEAYFPGKTQGLRAKLDRISSQADVATLQLESAVPPNSTVLELDDRAEGAVTGEPVVLIGYPTGIEGILARQGPEAAQKIVGGAQNINRIMAQLALQHLIRPTTTQGHVGDVLDNKIVHDAATTSGGSGGPLFNRDGKVIAINFATLKGFGGANLAVPARYAKELLK